MSQRETSGVKLACSAGCSEPSSFSREKKFQTAAKAFILVRGLKSASTRWVGNALMGQHYCMCIDLCHNCATLDFSNGRTLVENARSTMSDKTSQMCNHWRTAFPLGRSRRFYCCQATERYVGVFVWTRVCDGAQFQTNIGGFLFTLLCYVNGRMACERVTGCNASYLNDI